MNLLALLIAVAGGLTIVGMAVVVLVGRLVVGALSLAWQRRALRRACGGPSSDLEATLPPGTRHFLMSSVRFFFLGLQSAVTINLDQLILAHVVGLESVPGYVAVLRMVQALNLVASSLLAPAWPGFSRRLRPGTSRRAAANLLAATLTASQIAMLMLTLRLWSSEGRCSTSGSVMRP